MTHSAAGSNTCRDRQRHGQTDRQTDRQTVGGGNTAHQCQQISNKANCQNTAN